MNRLLFIGLLFFTMTNCSDQEELTRETDYKDDKFEVGQVWSYETREGEGNSTIQIVKIDKFESQETFIHVSVDGLRMKNSAIEGGISETISHLPFARKSVVESVTNLVSPKEELSDFEEGYQNWKKAFEAEEGGIFTIPISEVVEFIESSMN